MRVVPALPILATLTLGNIVLTACVPEAGQVSPPVIGGQAAAAPVISVVQRAAQEANRARERAQKAQEVAAAAQAVAKQATAEGDGPRFVVAQRGQTKFSGERADGQKTVRGVDVYGDGSRYEGEFIGATRNGLGVYTYKDGSRYAGEWREGRRSGVGVWSKDGASPRYDGEWQTSQRNGYGVDVDAQGGQYFGEFRGDRRHGLGALADAQGKVVTAGTWETGRQTAALPSNQGASQAPAAQRVSFGTGFHVTAQGAILTNEHVVKGCTQIGVRQDDGSFVVASFLRSDSAVDLALIETPRPAPAVATFRDSGDAREGEEIVVYGYPFGGQVSPSGTVTSGIVSSLYGLGGAKHQLQISAPVQTGNSGGPLLDRQGQIVGIVVSKLNALAVARVTGDVPQNVNFAVKAGPAVALMQAAGLTPVRPAARGGEKRIVDIADAAKRFTVLIRCQR
ncbi:MAG: trypsin-like peptidase domain-containing protein [Alphaproteobacteria bacterium]|nr:trypsin-like peptidase domain-containing protein [Alphaproteobacteria bacterium]